MAIEKKMASIEENLNKLLNEFSKVDYQSQYLENFMTLEDLDKFGQELIKTVNINDGKIELK